MMWLQLPAEVLLVQQALEVAEALVRANIESYEGRDQRLAATVAGQHGQVLALLRQALGLPEYVPPWETATKPELDLAQMEEGVRSQMLSLPGVQRTSAQIASTWTVEEILRREA